jgi:hypothetical protein
VDGANAGFCCQLHVTFGEDPDYDYKTISTDNSEIIPVAFSVENKTKLSHLWALMNKGTIAIHPKFDKLILSLRTAQANEYSLDKDHTVHNDLLDVLRLSLKGYVIS